MVKVYNDGSQVNHRSYKQPFRYHKRNRSVFESFASDTDATKPDETPGTIESSTTEDIFVITGRSRLREKNNDGSQLYRTVSMKPVHCLKRNRFILETLASETEIVEPDETTEMTQHSAAEEVFDKTGRPCFF